MRIRHTRCEVSLSPYRIKESTTMFSPVTPSFSSACAPPRVSNQRTGKVFNLEVSPSFIQGMDVFHPNSTNEFVFHMVKQRIMGWLNEALRPHGAYPSPYDAQFQNLSKAVKYFNHSNERRLVVLTHQDALDVPLPGGRPVVNYVYQVSESGTPVPISSENKNTLVAFINQLYADLGISGEIPPPVLNDIKTFFGKINK